MKVLQANKFFYIKGGSGRVFFDTIRILEERGHDVATFSMKDDNNFPSQFSDYFIENIDFSKASGTLAGLKKAGHFLYSLESRSKIETLIKQAQPDVAHLHNFTHQLTVSILSALKKNKIPIVQTLHDYQLICPNYRMFTGGQVCERCKKRKFYNAILHKCVANSVVKSALLATDLSFQRLFKLYEEKVDAFIAPSLFLKNKMQEWGVIKPIYHIPYSVNFEQYVPNPEPGNYLLYVGRLSEEKGLVTLLKAMRELPDVALKIVGNGPLRSHLVNYVMKKNIKNVEFLGSRYGSALDDIIRYARFIVVPSEWYENYPMAILEAMASGKPVLGARIGGIPEMVENDKTGWLFEPLNAEDLIDKIQKVVGNEDLIKECGSNARKIVEQKNCSRLYYEALMAVYKYVA
ncbi:MAG: glycosyltransferase family 4 protein [Candidatus Falkowbacteria bacterium]